MKFLLHVNYLEGDGDALPRLFALARRAGCDGVELRWQYRYQDRTQQEYRKLVSDLKQQYPDMEIVFGGGVDFVLDKNGKLAEETAEYLKFMEWAHDVCGTKTLNFFTGWLLPEKIGFKVGSFHLAGSGMAGEREYQRAASGLRKVGDRAAALGMKIALETHNGQIHDLAAPCAKLLAMTDHPAVGVNFDQGNIVLNRNGESIPEVFRLLKGKIYYAHLKNMLLSPLPEGGCTYAVTRLDGGYIDQRLVMEYLKKELRGDAVAIEYPCPGDGVIAALRDMEYIRFLKQEISIQ